MTQKEAFEFLELAESANKSQIRIRLVEKLEYFEHLSEHASSDFLRRIHAKNIDKVRSIQQEFFPWSSFESESEVVLPLEGGDIVIEDEMVYTIPVIVGSGIKQQPEPVKHRSPPAWLVSHNEGEVSKAYPLQEGKNYIGRKLQPGLDPFLVIDNDPYVSRVHAVVHAIIDKPWRCLVMDSAGSNGGAASSNGTYINGDPKRISKEAALKENDTVQIGKTKLVLKFNVKGIREILSDVEASDYVPTVAIKSK